MFGSLHTACQRLLKCQFIVWTNSYDLYGGAVRNKFLHVLDCHELPQKVVLLVICLLIHSGQKT